MKKILEDDLNLKILKLVCEGEGVEINISELAKMFGKHRNTIKNRLDKLLDNNIIYKPLYPFFYIYKQFPLFVIEKNYFMRDEKTDYFIEKDPAIWGAFSTATGAPYKAMIPPLVILLTVPPYSWTL